MNITGIIYYLLPIAYCLLPYASVGIHMHPPRIRMHPYAPMRLHYASERQYSTHIFAEKVKSQKSKKCRSRKVLIAFCTVKSVRIQPNIANYAKIRKKRKKCKMHKYQLKSCFFVFFATQRGLAQADR